MTLPRPVAQTLNARVVDAYLVLNAAIDRLDRHAARRACDELMACFDDYEAAVQEHGDE